MHLGPVVDGIGNSMHGHRVAADKVTPKVDALELVQLGIETGNLPNVITDRNEQ